MKRSEIVETTGSNTGVDRNPSVTDAEPRTEHRDSGSYLMNTPIHQPGPDYAWLNRKKQLLRDMDRLKKEHKARLRDAQLL